MNPEQQIQLMQDRITQIGNEVDEIGKMLVSDLIEPEEAQKELSAAFAEYSNLHHRLRNIGAL
jgi:hypothetical protein